MNTGLLFDFLASNIRCEECLHIMMNCELSTSTRSGFSHEIILTCSNCENAHLKLNTSSDSAQELKSSEPSKKKRKTLRAIKKGFIDIAQAAEGDVYTPGGH